SASGSTSRPGRPCDSSRARSAPSRSCRSAARSSCTVSSAERWARCRSVASQATLKRTGRRRLAMTRISRTAYAALFGPTTGDRVRLGDTELVIEVEADRAVYGDEVKFGGGKVIRDGMGQSQRVAAECADLVITNALIVDWWGIVKADVGVKHGRIAGIGKAGNPDTQDGVDIVIGAATEIVAGEGRILTAGG